jgi:hypothetical protein
MIKKLKIDDERNKKVAVPGRYACIPTHLQHTHSYREREREREIERKN